MAARIGRGPGVPFNREVSSRGLIFSVLVSCLAGDEGRRELQGDVLSEQWRRRRCWSRMFLVQEAQAGVAQAYEFVPIPASGSAPRSITASPEVRPVLVPCFCLLQADPAPKDPGR